MELHSKGEVPLVCTFSPSTATFGTLWEGRYLLPLRPLLLPSQSSGTHDVSQKTTGPITSCSETHTCAVFVAADFKFLNGWTELSGSLELLFMSNKVHATFWTYITERFIALLEFREERCTQSSYAHSYPLLPI